MRTAEGELEVEVPQVREAAEPYTSKLFPRGSKRLLATEPLKAMVVGAFVRGLSLRDVESLCEEAGLGRAPARAPPLGLLEQAYLGRDPGEELFLGAAKACAEIAEDADLGVRRQPCELLQALAVEWPAIECGT